jgi:hypothetical protein
MTLAVMGYHCRVVTGRLPGTVGSRCFQQEWETFCLVKQINRPCSASQEIRKKPHAPLLLLVAADESKAFQTPPAKKGVS